MKVAWIKDRLLMGKATCFSALVKKLAAAKKGGWGHVEYEKIKTIKL